MKVGVVGASIAGGYFAHLAANHDFSVDLFDPRAPWDKPCGGGITGKAMATLARFPAIASRAEAITEFSLSAPSGARAAFATDAPLYLLPRIELGQSLVQAAIDAGATLVPDKVRQVMQEADGSWSVNTLGHTYHGYDHLVGADGAVSTVRRAVDRPFARDDLILALDYHLEGPDTRPRVALKFLGGGMGYLWLFVARRYASAGIGLPAVGSQPVALEEALHDFLAEEWPSAKIDEARASRWVIPYHSEGFERRYRVQGDGWSLIGDAAGLADPLTGEGIYYAVKSAELLADALAAGQPAGYGATVEQEIRPELSKAFNIGRDYFHGRILDVLMRVARRSPRLRDFLADYLTGNGSYLTARRRLKRRAWRILGEVALSGLWRWERRESPYDGRAAEVGKKTP